MKPRRLLCALLCAVFLLSACACTGNKTQNNDVQSTAEQSVETASESTVESEAQFEDFEDHYVDALPENAEDGLTLHAFNWTYKEITANLESIKNAGFRNVLTMPVQQPKSGGASWWAFYQPLSMSIGDNSSLGTKEDLRELCDKAEEMGIAILADIVANHLATTDDDAAPSVNG